MAWGALFLFTGLVLCRAGAGDTSGGIHYADASRPTTSDATRKTTAVPELIVNPGYLADTDLCPSTRRLNEEAERLSEELKTAGGKRAAEIKARLDEIDATLGHEASLTRKAEALIPKIVEAWKKLAPPLIAATESLVGKKFKASYHPTLTVCKDLVPMSMPLLIHARDFVEPFKDKTAPLEEVVDQIYHELLHVYLYENFSFLRKRGLIERSPLVQTLAADEDDTVRYHLHLNAIQKAVFLSLGEEGKKKLEETIRFDSRISPSYARSWKIIDGRHLGKPTHEWFLKELRQLAGEASD